MSDLEWDLITKMCAAEPSARVRITYIVDKLKQLVRDSEQSRSGDFGKARSTWSDIIGVQHLNDLARNDLTSTFSLLYSVVCVVFQNQTDSVEEIVFAEFGDTILNTLQMLQLKCAKLPEED